MPWIKYYWQALKCAWGFHAIQRRYENCVDPSLYGLPGYQGSTINIDMCSACDYHQETTTAEFKGQFKL